MSRGLIISLSLILSAQASFALSCRTYMDLKNKEYDNVTLQIYSQGIKEGFKMVGGKADIFEDFNVQYLPTAIAEKCKENAAQDIFDVARELMSTHFKNKTASDK